MPRSDGIVILNDIPIDRLAPDAIEISYMIENITAMHRVARSSQYDQEKRLS